MGATKEADERYSVEPFAEALDGLLRREQKPGPFKGVNRRAFFRQVPNWSYEHLRRMTMGERPLTTEAIEAIAAVLNIKPEYFLDYRALQVQEVIKRYPYLADKVYEQLMAFARSVGESSSR